MFETNPLWPHVYRICETLKNNGYTAWLAGGCVRDALLNLTPHDFDVVTNALPDSVQNLFPKSIDVGKSFGVITVPVFENNQVITQIEIATFRSDGDYLNGRHPSKVVFSTPEEDALRRDFTVNAMFYDPFSKQIIDYVNGQMDLKSKVIKAVGDPFKRFEEDKLRMMRAVRFKCQLNFELEESTQLAIQTLAPNLKVISKERISYELKRIFESKNATSGLKLLVSLRLWEVFWTESNSQKLNEAFENLEFAEQNYDLSSLQKWILFLLTFDSENVKLNLLNLKQPKIIFEIYFYVTDVAHNIQNFSKGQSYEIAFSEYSEILIAVLKVYFRREQSNLKIINQLEGLKNDFKELPKPILRGQDLMQMGVSQGPEIKKWLTLVYHYQLEYKIDSKNELISWTKKQIS